MHHFAAFLLLTPSMAAHQTPRRKHDISSTSPEKSRIPVVHSSPLSSSSSSSSSPESSTRNGKVYHTQFAYPPVRTSTRTSTPLTHAPAPRAAPHRHYVFVYGTLKQGFANAHYLHRATYIGEFRTTTRYPLVVGGRYHSPYLLDLPSKGSKVKGELYAVDNSTLADLDHLENVGVNYTRRVAKVSNTADRAFIVEAFVYFKVNGLNALVDKPFLDDYQCRKYVPRHMRPRETTEVAARR